MKSITQNIVRSLSVVLVSALCLQSLAGPSIRDLRQVRDELQRRLEQTDDPGVRLTLLNKLDEANAEIVKAQRDPVQWEVDLKIANDKAEKKNIPVVMVFLSPVELNSVAVNRQRAEIFSDEFSKLAGRAVFLLMEKDPEKDKTTQFTHEIFKVDGYPQIVVYDRSKKTVSYRIKGMFEAEKLTEILGAQLPSAK